MSVLSWFPLGLLCALSLATADALTKRFFADCSGPELVVIRFASPALLLLPLLVLFPLPPVPPAFWLLIAILLPLEFLAMGLYMVAIRDWPLHLTMPYLAFTPVFNVLTGLLILGERVSAAGFAGILLVVAGTWVLNADPARPRALLAPFAAVFRVRGSRLMLAVACIYSLTSVLGKRAMRYADPVSFGPFYMVLLGAVSLLVLPAGRRVRPRLIVRRWPRVLLVGASMAVMISTHFLAIAHVQVAYFIALKRTSLLFGILYGGWLFREQHLRRSLVAGALMVAGVVLIVAA